MLAVLQEVLSTSENTRCFVSRCYMRSPKPGWTLRMHSTKWKIIWKVLSFPKAKILDLAPVSSRQAVCTEGKESCY